MFILILVAFILILYLRVEENFYHQDRSDIFNEEETGGYGIVPLCTTCIISKNIGN
jgi:hypothetical protein